MAVLHDAGFLASPTALYYERLAPERPTGDPLVLVHGGAHTGACYRATPDGRPGWADDFLAQGFEVFVPDWPGSGRSGYVPMDVLRGELVVAALGALLEHIGRPVTVLVHSMSGPYGFKLLETARRHVARLVAVAPGPPGNIQPQPTIQAEDDEAVEVQALALRWRLPKQQPFVFERQMAVAKLIGRGRRFPMAALDTYLASLQPVAPRLLYERQNVGGNQLRLSEPVDLDGARVLVLTGTDDTDHPRSVDEPIVAWLVERAARADFCWLGDRGIQGNGHMLMLEDNSAEIARIIGEWIRADGRQAPER